MRSFWMRPLAIVLLLAAGLFAQSAAPNGAFKKSDPNALRITSGPKVEFASATSAVIAWSTNVSAATIVRYGTDPEQLSKKAQMPWGGLTHRVTLKNLEPNTTYYFQADSSEGAGTGGQIQSTVSKFETKQK